MQAIGLFQQTFSDLSISIPTKKNCDGRELVDHRFIHMMTFGPSQPEAWEYQGSGICKSLLAFRA